MDDDGVLRELRKQTRILLLAHGEAVERRVKGFLDHAPTRTVLTILADGAMSSDALQAKAKAAGVPRSSLFRIITDLERAGLVDRPRRGTVELAELVIPFVPQPRAKNDEAQLTDSDVAAGDA